MGGEGRKSRGGGGGRDGERKGKGGKGSGCGGAQKVVCPRAQAGSRRA